MRKTILALCIPAIAGCAHFPLPPAKQDNSAIASYVAPEIHPTEADEIARDMAAFLSHQLPPAKTTLKMEPARTLLHEILVHELAARGFGVIDAGQEPEHEAVSLRYFVTGLDDGILVRMKYGHSMAGRFFGRTDHASLSFSSVYAVREATQ